MSVCHGCGIFSRVVVLFAWSLLGIIFLPFTALMYVLVYNPLVGVTGWFWMILGVVLGISSYASSAYSNRNRMPGYSGT
jgi:hypothetical protein